MKHYDIPNLPEEIDELLYDWQRAEILKKIEAPIAVVNQADSVWQRLDDRLTGANMWSNLSKDGEVQCTTHEILPGVYAAWLMEDSADGSMTQAILINATDLQLFMEGGLDSLVQYHLFKNF